MKMDRVDALMTFVVGGGLYLALLPDLSESDYGSEIDLMYLSPDALPRGKNFDRCPQPEWTQNVLDCGLPPEMDLITWSHNLFDSSSSASLIYVVSLWYCPEWPTCCSVHCALYARHLGYIMVQQKRVDNVLPGMTEPLLASCNRGLIPDFVLCASIIPARACQCLASINVRFNLDLLLLENGVSC
jgi:hypothetical protein